MSFFQLHHCKCGHYFASHQRTHHVNGLSKDGGEHRICEYTLDADCGDCICPRYVQTKRRFKHVRQPLVVKRYEAQTPEPANPL